MTSSAPPTQSKKRTARIAFALAGAGALVAGAVLRYYLVVQPQAQLRAAEHWQPTTCEITRSVVEKHESNSGRLRDRHTSYDPAVEYRYAVQGKVYTGNRIHFLTITSGGTSDAETVVQKYARGTTTGCWYDPAAPSEAVLDRTLTWDSSINLIPLGFFLGGIIVLLFAAIGNFDNVYSGNRPLPSGAPPIVAPKNIGDVESILAAQVGWRHPELARRVSGITPRMMILAILVIVAFVGAVVVYGYRTIVSLP